MNKALASVVASGAIGLAGLGLLQMSEGKLNAVYKDPAGILTVCYGHTGPELRLGQFYTDDQCDTILARDILSHRAGIDKCINLSLTRNEYDAVLDLAFNVGVTAVCKSTLVRRINSGDNAGASNEFLRWNKARVRGKVVVLRGLTKRREAERALFLTPDDGGAYTGSAANLRALTTEYRRLY